MLHEHLLGLLINLYFTVLPLLRTKPTEHHGADTSHALSGGRVIEVRYSLVSWLVCFVCGKREIIFQKCFFNKIFNYMIGKG